MNNLLTRELPLHSTIRLWDTYLAESDGFAVFQLYVCAAFLLHWRKQLLKETEFQVGAANKSQHTHTHIINKLNLSISRLGINAAASKFAHTKLERFIYWYTGGRGISLEIHLR